MEKSNRLFKCTNIRCDNVNGEFPFVETGHYERFERADGRKKFGAYFIVFSRCRLEALASNRPDDVTASRVLLLCTRCGYDAGVDTLY